MSEDYDIEPVASTNNPKTLEEAETDNPRKKPTTYEKIREYLSEYKARKEAKNNPEIRRAEAKDKIVKYREEIETRELENRAHRLESAMGGSKLDKLKNLGNSMRGFLGNGGVIGRSFSAPPPQMFPQPRQSSRQQSRQQQQMPPLMRQLMSPPKRQENRQGGGSLITSLFGKERMMAKKKHKHKYNKGITIHINK